MKIAVHFPTVGVPPDAAFWYDEKGYLAEDVVTPGPSAFAARARVAAVDPDDFEDWADLVPEYTTDVWESFDTEDPHALLLALGRVGG